MARDDVLDSAAEAPIEDSDALNGGTRA